MLGFLTWVGSSLIYKIYQLLWRKSSVFLYLSFCTGHVNYMHLVTMYIANTNGKNCEIV